MRPRSRTFLRSVASLALGLALASAAGASGDKTPGDRVEREDTMTVAAGRLVTFEYTLKDDNQTVLDTNVGSEPFAYTHGRHEVVAGLEKALAGMKVGEEKSVTVKPEEAYGQVSQKALVEIPIERIPEEARKAGTQLQGQGQDGQPIFPTVREVRESTVVLDFNHPLAGKNLHFEVKILSIQEPMPVTAPDAGGSETPQS